MEIKYKNEMYYLGNQKYDKEKFISLISGDLLRDMITDERTDIIKEDTDYNVEINNKASFEKKINIEKLYYPTNIKKNLETQIHNALLKGKHIILVGPPGTGKSKLAKEVSIHYRNKQFNLVTANSDWTTFDTIGGYKPQKDGSLEFEPGLFLNQFKFNNRDINNWLIIDEINRADIDKAFGALFSALSGEQVTLSFKHNNGKNIIITNNSNKSTFLQNIYRIHEDWRLIATMNTLDKTSLYEMSYAFMRRFAFISVPAPTNISVDLIKKYLHIWLIDNQDYVETTKKIWMIINDYRKIGPALIKDFYEYLIVSRGDFVSAINMFLIPQLEGLYDEKIIEFRDKVLELEFIEHPEFFENFINEFLMLEV